MQDVRATRTGTESQIRTDDRQAENTLLLTDTLWSLTLHTECRVAGTNWNPKAPQWNSSAQAIPALTTAAFKRHWCLWKKKKPRWVHMRLSLRGGGWSPQVTWVINLWPLATNGARSLSQMFLVDSSEGLGHVSEIIRLIHLTRVLLLPAAWQFQKE